jgi:Tfp pilus assembly protein PilF
MIIANNLATLLAEHRTDKASMERANSVAVLLMKTQIPQFKDTLGWVSYRRGNYSEAVTLLEGAVAELPNIPAVHYHLAMCYLAIGQHTKASEHFNKARELAPHDTELKSKIDAALKGGLEKAKERK